MKEIKSTYYGSVEGLYDSKPVEEVKVVKKPKMVNPVDYQINMAVNAKPAKGDVYDAGASAMTDALYN